MIEVLVGISGSGKSEYAKRKRDSNGMDDTPTIIVNRDKIRELLFGFNEETIENYYTRPDIGKNEQRVTDYETVLIRHALNNNTHVIVDATHTKLKYVNRFKSFGVPVKFTLFDCDIETAFKRQKNRTRQVSKDIITRQYNDLQKLESDFDFAHFYNSTVSINNSRDIGPSIFVFDIDGTLADKGDRSPYDWGRVLEDKAREDVSRINRLFQEYDNIAICTGRDGCCEEDTKKWLSDNHIGYHEFYIRKTNDCRPDWLVKQEFWEDICTKYYIEAIIDDRKQVVDHARRLGFNCWQVQPGNF